MTFFKLKNIFSFNLHSVAYDLIMFLFLYCNIVSLEHCKVFDFYSNVFTQIMLLFFMSTQKLKQKSICMYIYIYIMKHILAHLYFCPFFVYFKIYLYINVLPYGIDQFYLFF